MIVKGEWAQPDWAYELPDWTGPDTQINWTHISIFITVKSPVMKTFGFWTVRILKFFWTSRSDVILLLKANLPLFFKAGVLN